MNHYTHALIKEISAQKMGFEPSPMWGRLVAPGDLQEHKREYRHIMNAQKPEHILPSKAVDHVKKLAKDIVNQLPKDSHVKKDGFTL